MRDRLSILYFLLGALVLSLASSCVQHRQLVSFRKGEEPTLDQYRTAIELPVLRVQADDILHITVNSLADETSRPYNLSSPGNIQGGGGGGGGGGNGQINALLLGGYTVDSMGYIEFPNIGRIQVGGLSLEGVRDRIATAIAPYLKSPAVNVKFLNFRYTVLGDVFAPGTYTTINERVSLLEAIGTAGDFTNYARRDRVLVFREQDGQRLVVTLDLQDSDFLDSPYYYLQQNDVIYVEPTQAKVATVADPLSRFISYGSAFLSLITLTVTILLNTNSN